MASSRSKHPDAVLIAALLLVACQPVSIRPSASVETIGSPPASIGRASITPSASPPPAFGIVPCTLAVKDGFPVEGGDHDCRGSAGPTLNPGPGLGTYHITDKPKLGSTISLTVELLNSRPVASGPVTLVAIGPADGSFFFTDTFTPTGCRPKCVTRSIGADKTMATFEWTGKVKPGQVAKLTAMFKAGGEGYWTYQVGVFPGTSSELEDWFFAPGSRALIAEWGDVKSVVFR